MRATQVTPEVLVAQGEVVTVTGQDLAHLKGRVAGTAHRRVRLCAHPGNDDPLHEMLIVLAGSGYVRPHQHPGKSESFHVIEGQGLVVIFDASGAITQVVALGDLSSGRCFYYRLSAPLFHTVVVRSPVLVIHETTNGPFCPEETVYAAWAPAPEDTDAVHNYTAELAARVSQIIDTEEL